MSFLQPRSKQLKVDPPQAFRPFVVYDVNNSSPTGNFGYLEQSSNRSVARDSQGNLYSVYNGYNPSTTFFSIRISQSTDGGNTWTQAVLYSYASNSSFTPKIAIDGNDKIWVVWEGYGATSNPTKKNIHFITGTWGSWGSPQQITDLPNEQYVPGIAIDGNNDVHLTWYGFDVAAVNSTVLQIRYVKILNNETVGTIVTLTDEPQAQLDPTLAVDRSSNIHLAWYGIYTGDANWQLSYIKNTSGTWGSRQQVSTDAFTHIIPAMVLDSNDIPKIICFNYSQKVHEFYDDVAGVWQPRQIIEAIGAQFNTYMYTTLAIDAQDTLHALYMKGGALNSNATQIRYSKMVAGSGTWSSPLTFNNESFSPFPGKEYQEQPTSMFAVWPRVGGVSTNIPAIGAIGTWMDNNSTTDYSLSGNILGYTTSDYAASQQRSITGVANIATGTVTTTQTETGVARIQKSVSKTETGVSRITISTSKTETGLARITAATTRTISALARITATTLKTITGLSRITVSTLKTITGISRVTISTSHTETGISRVTAATSKTILGLARVTASTSKTETGVGRVTATATHTETGVARIQIITAKTTTGVARITAATQKTETGVARITATTSRTETGKTAILKTTSQTINGLSRIQIVTSKTETGLARITNATLKTETGVARVTASASQTEQGVARITASARKTESGVARVQLITSKTETGTARVTDITSRTETGVARITASTAHTETGVARIQKSVSKTITGTGAVGLLNNKTETGVANIIQVRYWVGGTAAWDATAGTKWSNTSGGTGGASVPTASTYVIFDGNSGSGTVTIQTAVAAAAGFDASAFTGTLVQNQNFSVGNATAGDFILGSGMTFSWTAGTTKLVSTRAGNVVDLAGKQLGSLTFNATTGTWKLLNDIVLVASALTSLTNGTIDLNGYDYLSDSQVTSSTATRSFIMNGGRIRLRGTGAVWATPAGTLTFDNTIPGAIRIENTSASAKSFSGGTVTYPSIEVLGAALSGIVTFAGAFTTSTLKFNPDASVKFTSGVTTTASALDWTGTSGHPITVQSITPTSAATISVASGIISADWLVLQDSAATGGATFYAGTNSVDATGNSGWIFASPSTPTDQTETGVARITATTAETITGKARITASTSKTETGISSILRTTSKTETGISRVTKVDTQTEQGLSRITATTSRTETGLARILKTASATETGKARITVATPKTETGTARVTATMLKTETGTSRITATATKTETGTARITVSTSRTTTGQARITIQSSKAETGVARISRTGTQTETGLSRITKIVQRTIQALSRITRSVLHTVTGTARLVISASRTITGIAFVVVTNSQNETGKAQIAILREQTITGVASIEAAKKRGNAAYILPNTPNRTVELGTAQGANLSTGKPARNIELTTTPLSTLSTRTPERTVL